MNDDKIIKEVTEAYNKNYGVGCYVGDLLGIINRQKAEIERLRDEVKEKTETITFLKDQAVGWSIDFCNLKAKLAAVKAEAIKEFVRIHRKYMLAYCAEAIKWFVRIHREYMLAYCDDDDQISLKVCEYDAITENLVKEMEQGNES